MKKQALSILFIGNSHTYYNDMPEMVRQRAAGDGFDCHVAMIAHGGWFLEQHVKEPDVRFNILFGHYDYVVLQDHTHPMAPEEELVPAAAMLNVWIREAGSIPVIYETWAKKDAPEDQDNMNRVHRKAADTIGALLAPVGENWRAYQADRPNLEMYAVDGKHASEDGSDFAAKCIWETIRRDIRNRENAGSRKAGI